MGKKPDHILDAKLDDLQSRFPPTFPRLIDIIIDEAWQSDHLESHWYHVYGEVFSTLTRAISNMETVFSVAPQRTFTLVPPQPVYIDRTNRPITRPLGEENDEDEDSDEDSEDGGDSGGGEDGEDGDDDEDNEDDEDGEDGEDDVGNAGDVDMEDSNREEEDAQMEQIDTFLARMLGNNPDVSGSTATTGYSEGAILRTPDFTVYLHNFRDGVSVPVMVVEDKPTPAPRTIKGKLFSLTEGSYADRQAAAAFEMKNHLEQKKEQLTHLFDEYRSLKFVYYCLTVGEWFRLYEVDRDAFLGGARQNPLARVKLLWDNGVINRLMLEVFTNITQPDKFY